MDEPTKTDTLRQLDNIRDTIQASVDGVHLKSAVWGTIVSALWNERARCKKRKVSVQRSEQIKQLAIAINAVRTLV